LYVRLVRFKLGPGMHDTAESIADKIVPAIRSRPGCQRAEFIADYGEGEYGIVVFWESREAADAGASVIGPILTEAMARAKAVAEIRLFDVYEPKS
jgi:quinol monooxygenase YgiN